MNYFSAKSAAERYAKGRPYFHPMIVRRVKESLSIVESLSSALDVGCGTGLSTMALKEVARNVTGVDASAEMVALAPRADGIRYVVTPAENLPFEEDEFDLITLSQVFHWLDRDRFLTEANRVLRPGGWLIVYDNYFSGRMMGDLEIHGWYKEYLAKYPAPPRGEITFTAENTNRYGFRLLKEERYENVTIFSIKTLVDYLATQSNVIAAVESGKEEIGQAKTWLAEIIQPAFGSAEEAEFLFDAPVWYLRRAT